MTERQNLASELILDLNALLRNWQRLASCGQSSDCAAVVKADAYGIGIEYAVPKLLSGGCQTFFAALPSEARLEVWHESHSLVSRGVANWNPIRTGCAQGFMSKVM